ncbi:MULTISPECIES: glycosyltransferase family 4 protein [Flagellimonas]|uniref:Glycosyltransferase family 4 protein n=1 Tax=Flagellimonas hadalis TaxID=2597517 RepID=A0A5N5ISQ5_9FLAO|nr:glycosyltransferase family 4 protein [Allomuricauda hadalis]KAB5488838.1 glycosyltransferase family 4 protein [Allomuricauda hadalis]
MNPKSKICHLTSPHPRYDTRIFYKECVSLAAEGYDVSLIVADGKSNEVRFGVNIIGVPKPNNKISRLLFTTKHIYKKALEVDAQIFHFHDPELIPVGLKLMRKGKKVVYDVHEDLPRQRFVKKFGTVLFRKPLEIILERVEKYAVSKFSAVFTSTPFINKRFEGVNKNLNTLCNFPVLSEFESDQVKWSEKSNKVSYVGDLILERGVYEMVRAVENIDVELSICGRFSDPGLKEGVEQLSGWNKVKYHGYVDREKVAEELSKSVAGLVTLLPHSNFIHSYPVKMFEYMAASIPIIASNFPLFKEIVEGNNCGLCVDPKNPDEIAKAIRYIIENPDEAENMGKNGKLAVEQIYSWDKEAYKLSNMYLKLMKE